ncbi:MAG: alpha-amylase family glycosyl hydrolase [Blastocatellia bacterium]
MIDINEVGAHPSVGAGGSLQVRFGIYLPGITFAKGYELIVRVIHEQDQFTPEIPPKEFFLFCHDDHEYDLWDATVVLTDHADPSSSFGKPGGYLYRYHLRRNGRVVTEWITDPFARATGAGQLSAFTISTGQAGFDWDDASFKVPELDDLIVYELQVEEFNDTFQGLGERLKYLRGLGVNAIEIMPVTSVKQVFDWGYGPLHFFAPEERYGSPQDMMRLVRACHNEGIAVILDSVYEHVDSDFAYNRVYADSNEPSPMIGPFVKGEFGTETDFNKPFTREYFQAVNAYWLDEYHVDGFRYDYVPGYYDGPMGNGYANLVYQTYQASLKMARFQGPGNTSRIIQCAEDLEAPQAILRETYTNCTWQNGLLDKAEDMAAHNVVDESFAHLLDPGFSGYPSSRDMNGVSVPVAPFQYVESHDHSYLITRVALLDPLGGAGDIQFGDRSKYYKLQPFAIALYTCQGIPMLWQGQEFAENYVLPEKGSARISFRRSLHWEYFYDEAGKALVRLYRRLGQLRQQHRALRGRESFYYNEQSRPWDGVVAYRRRAAATATAAEDVAMVFLNFSDVERVVSIPFPKAGAYREMIDNPRASGQPLEIMIEQDGQSHQVVVPSNYGQIFIRV